MDSKSKFWQSETGKMLLSKKTLILIAFLLVFALSVRPTLADTNIDNCTTLNTTGETYLLTADIIDSTESCMKISANSTFLDCQGHLIDGNFSENAIGISNDLGTNLNNFTLFDCVLTNWIQGIWIRYSSNINLSNINASFNQFSIELEVVSNSSLLNSTSNNNTNGDGVYIVNGNNISIINNTFSYNRENNAAGILFETQGSPEFLKNYIINNTIENNEIGIYCAYDCHNISVYENKIKNNDKGIDFEENTENLIYSNLLNNTANVFLYDDNESYSNFWNTTQQSGTRIYSAGTEIGGNYWTNSTANGYSDTCTDLLMDGFCDDPYDVGAGVACAAVADGLPACGNNTDWLPLSDEYVCQPSWNCTSWGECVRGYQTRECIDDNQCQNETGKPAEIQTCLKGIPNATFNITAGCCPISTLYCTTNETLIQLWNTSDGVSFAYQECEFGCDNVTSSCVPKPYETNLLIFGVVMFFVVLIFLMWRRRR